MTTVPDAPYTKTAAGVYAARLDGLAGRLHQLADVVASRGRPTASTVTMRPQHVAAALTVQRLVLRGVAELGLDELVRQAVAADHPGADVMPGVLLDRAAGAAEGQLARASQTSALNATEVAEAVLRAVGLLP